MMAVLCIHNICLPFLHTFYVISCDNCNNIDDQDAVVLRAVMGGVFPFHPYQASLVVS
jgi:hypothetical protein